MAWIWGEIDFASLYSYRMPNLSPSFALSSPVPSPAALRLALVDAAIKSTGSVAYGEEIFKLIKTARLEIEPPEKVAVLKFFIKRLKPAKRPKTGFEESFGVREYCHFLGPLKVYFNFCQNEQDMLNLFTTLRRLGTTDSLAKATGKIDEKEPNWEFTCKETSELKHDASSLIKRPVSMLNELKENATFSQVNPFSKKRKKMPYIQKFFILPLIEERRGENWVIYKKVPFAL